jgi:hypothetical protein
MSRKNNAEILEGMKPGEWGIFRGVSSTDLYVIERLENDRYEELWSPGHTGRYTYKVEFLRADGVFTPLEPDEQARLAAILAMNPEILKEVLMETARLPT